MATDFCPWRMCHEIICIRHAPLPRIAGHDHRLGLTDQLAPYVSRALDWFGASRLMFGSDWPVCLLAAPYGEVVRGYGLAVGEISPHEREQIFGTNALSWYRLGIFARTEAR